MQAGPFGRLEVWFARRQHRFEAAPFESLESYQNWRISPEVRTRLEPLGRLLARIADGVFALATAQPPKMTRRNRYKVKPK
jgi:hypothetical protein